MVRCCFQRRVSLTYDSYDLPADVFDEGEIRPTKTKKTKATKGAQAPPANKKRTVSSAELDVSQREKDGAVKRRVLFVSSLQA